MVFLKLFDKMSAFNEHQFEKKLSNLKDSQDSIQTLSAWCLQHRQHHKKIVSLWLKVLRKVKPDQRLTLFYLANDVIQYSKRKNYEYVQAYAPALQKATTLVRDNKVKQSILRIFKIWDERGIYDEAFISDLTGLLTTSTKGQSIEQEPSVPDFQPRILIEKIKSCKECEDETDLLLKKLNDSHLSLSDADALRASLKDRRQGDDVVSEVDEGVAKMEAYVRALELELKERSVLIDLLDQGNIFYDTQKGEAKVVANAYKNFGARVKNLKRRLDELIPTLKDSSPVPSPDINAPSPSPDSDIELPEEMDAIPGLLNQTSSSSFDAVVSDHQSIKPLMKGDLPDNLDNRLSSFMGNSLPFDFKKNIFNETSTDTPRSPSPTPPLESGDNDLSSGELILPSALDEGKPIEVISSRLKTQENFNISEFLKTLSQGLSEPFLQTDSSSSAIPGLSISNPAGASALSPSIKALVGSTTPLFSSPPGVFELPSGQYSYQKTVQSPVNQTPIVNPSDPLPPPPPLPPGLFMSEDGEWTEREGGSQLTSPGEWNTKLPPKFPTWGDPSPVSAWESACGNSKKSAEKVDWFADSLGGKPSMESKDNKVIESIEETPESPPNYEKEGFSDPVEYDDTEVPDPPSNADVDHRTLVPLAPNNRLRETKDIDHRNLISLTGSPAPNFRPINSSGSPWTQSESKVSDQDYRNVSSINAAPSGGVTAPRGKDREVDCDYRIPIPPPITGKLPEALKRDESHDNIESVDMEMSDEEDNPDSMGKDQNAKSEEKETSGRNLEKRGNIGKSNLRQSSKSQSDDRTAQEGFFSENKIAKSESFDTSFTSLPLQKIQTIGTDRGIFRQRTPASQTFHSPVVRQTFESHFPAMPPVPPSAPMFRMPPHDLAKPPPPIMSLTQPLLLQQKPPPPPPPPPLPNILATPVQKTGINDRDTTPVQSVSLNRNLTSNLSHSSVPSRFQSSSDLKSPLSSQSISISDTSSGMKWGNNEVMEKDGSWGSVTGYGEQANGSFKNSQNEDLKKSTNEKESFGHSSSSDVMSNDFRTGSALRILSLAEINTKDPPPYPSTIVKDKDVKEITSENIPVIPNASLTLPDDNSVVQSVSTSEDKSISGINVVSSVTAVEALSKEGIDGIEEPLAEQTDTEQGSIKSLDHLNASEIHDFSRDEIQDAFFSPTLAFPPPGLGFTVPPPQRGRGRGFRGGGPIRFGIPPILPRFFRPPPLFPPMRQPISPDVQFVGGRGPRTPFRPFRGNQGPFGGRW